MVSMNIAAASSTVGPAAAERVPASIRAWASIRQERAPAREAVHGPLRGLPADLSLAVPRYRLRPLASVRTSMPCSAGLRFALLMESYLRGPCPRPLQRCGGALSVYSSYAASGRAGEAGVVLQPSFNLREGDDSQAAPADDAKLRLNVALEG